VCNCGSQVRELKHRLFLCRLLSSEVDPFVYTRVIVSGGVASTLPGSSLRLESSSKKVDLEKARQQQREYVEVGGVWFAERS
jgi:hypothetical protein